MSIVLAYSPNYPLSTRRVANGYSSLMKRTNEQDGLFRIRHSAAHVLAEAVIEMFPDAKLGIGPPTDTGFYYDFDLGHGADGRQRTFSADQLEELETRMRRTIAGHHPFVRRVVSAVEANTLFAQQPYKLELIRDLAARASPLNGPDQAGVSPEELTTYRQDTFEDLCRGPHVEHTGQIPPDAFKLLAVTSAYWRGSERNPSLQRIYGTAWRNRKELKEHIEQLEEAKKRDHRKLGRELEIFCFDDDIGPGLPLWLPNGGIIIEELERLAKDVESKAGYQRVRSPHVAREELFLRSGHLPYYAESMFPPMVLDTARYYLKPMNCPFHHRIYSARGRSYRDLPLRLAEYGTCYRFEKSGELFGTMRTRSMQMNDAHIYCSEAQFESEFLGVVGMYLSYFKLFAIDKYEMRLSTHHPRGLGKKYVDNARLWAKTEDMVRAAMTKSGVPYVEVADEAAFYGPKIDVQVWSAVGREFTLATNQVDFAQPQRFELTFTNSLNEPETPLCIHRAPLGTHERLIGFLLEHFGGNLPVWLAPEQVRIIPITDANNGCAQRLESTLRDAGIRVRTDVASERMNAKIRAAQLMKIPYMAVIGPQEEASDTVALRRRDGTREVLPVDDFVTQIRGRAETRTIEL
jgi:threonyl-tRNA synthetase